MGLGKGGSLDNAIIVSGEKVLNQDGLRYKDEFVRHKVLDCVGDLYLSGYKVIGKIYGYQSGHEMTAMLLKRFLRKKVIMKLFKFVVLILFIFAFSCASEKQIVFNEEKISDPKKMYINAFSLYQSGKYNEAIDLFEKIELNFSHLSYGPKSLLMISYISMIEQSS